MDGRQIVGATHAERACRMGAGAVLDSSHPWLSSALVDLTELGMCVQKERWIMRSTALEASLAVVRVSKGVKDG